MVSIFGKDMGIFVQRATYSLYILLGLILSHPPRKCARAVWLASLGQPLSYSMMNYPGTRLALLLTGRGNSICSICSLVHSVIPSFPSSLQVLLVPLCNIIKTKIRSMSPVLIYPKMSIAVNVVLEDIYIELAAFLLHCTTHAHLVQFG